MNKIDWKTLEKKSHDELMAIIGKIDTAAKDAIKAGEAFCAKYDKDIKRAICGSKGSISGEINKENIDKMVDALAEQLNKKVDTKDVLWEVLAAIAVNALKQGLNNYCEHYTE